MKIDELGIDVPLRYTVEAQTKIAKAAGGLEQIESYLSDKDAAETTEHIIFMAAAMMEGSINREKVKCKILGNEYKGPNPIPYEDLRLFFNALDIKEISAEVLNAMKSDNKSTVEIKAEKRKNAEATQ